MDQIVLLELQSNQTASRQQVLGKLAKRWGWSNCQLLLLQY